MFDSAALVLRADAVSATGTGHAMRCLALAQAWCDAGGTAHLATAALPPRVEQRYAEEGVRVRWLRSEPGGADDARQTGECARQLGARWIVADGYSFGVEWQRAVRLEAPAGLVCLDDDGQVGAYDADVVLDQNLDADPARYARRASHTRLVLGCRHALLRREFRVQLSARRTRGTRRVLVTMGGSDPRDATRRIVAALGYVRGRRVEICVVAGPAFPNLGALRAEAARARANGSTVAVRTAVNDMPALMAWADVAIAAAGSTCWELARMGLPTITLVTAPNQRRIAERLAARGVTRDAGPFESCDPDAVAAAAASLLDAPADRAAMTARARALVDGRGAERISRLLARARRLAPAQGAGPPAVAA